MDYEALSELGLSPGQIRVYAAVLELGRASLNSIQEKTGIERRNIYDTLNKLIEKGFITYILEQKKRTYQTTHPRHIQELIDKKQSSLAQLENAIPSFEALFNEKKTDVRAEIFRGNEAIKALHNESLNYDATYWIGGNSGVEQSSLKFWFKHWMSRRVKAGKWMYDLVDAGTFLEDLPPNDLEKHKKNLYKYCTLPIQLKSPMVIIIFGNKVAQILWNDQPFAFVMESEDIKESYMNYFHHFWKDPY